MFAWKRILGYAGALLVKSEKFSGDQCRSSMSSFIMSVSVGV